MLIANPRAKRAFYSSDLKKIMNIVKARESRSWLTGWSLLSRVPTPVWSLPGLAEQLEISSLYVKDESKRSTLGSFKALGAPIALLRLIMRTYEGRNYRPDSLLAAAHADDLGDFVVISATDGNHGRALAAAAQSVGCRCVIVLHKNVSQEREDAIATYGAEIIRVAGNYDESVNHAARLANYHGWHVVSDTSYDGYEDIPRDVMQGYGTIIDELCEQIVDDETGGTPFTHVFLQGGVGGLGAGVVSFFVERYGDRRPTFIVVEPEQADCLYQSVLLGRAAKTIGSVDSVMAGLACGEASPLAWKFLENYVDFFMTICDEDAVRAMRLLATGSDEDIPIVAGESGAAGLAAIQNLMKSPIDRDRVNITGASRVLVINTEAATAPTIYKQLIGLSADATLAAQTDWLSRQAHKHGERIHCDHQER